MQRLCNDQILPLHMASCNPHRTWGTDVLLSFPWGSWWSQRHKVSWPRPHSVKGSALLLAQGTVNLRLADPGPWHRFRSECPEFTLGHDPASFTVLCCWTDSGPHPAPGSEDIVSGGEQWRQGHQCQRLFWPSGNLWVSGEAGEGKLEKTCLGKPRSNPDTYKMLWKICLTRQPRCFSRFWFWVCKRKTFSNVTWWGFFS